MTNQIVAVFLPVLNPRSPTSPPLLIILIVLIAIGLRIARILRRRKRGGRLAQLPPVRPVHPHIPSARQAAAAERESLIDSIRRLVGPAPRSFDASLRDYLQISPPTWLRGNQRDELSQVFSAQQRLRRDGPVVWAAIVQANNLLFKPGSNDHPASIVWSSDTYFDTHPRELISIGPELFAVKGTDQADPESAEFSRILANEKIRAPRLKVPSRFTGGRKVYHSSLMLTRKHLPQGILSGQLMPVWIDPQPTGLVLLVPAAYWPAPLLALWETDARLRQQ